MPQNALPEAGPIAQALQVRPAPVDAYVPSCVPRHVLAGELCTTVTMRVAGAGTQAPAEKT